ncbi:hypothetical protein [Klebsiella pneumoniae]|uniref:hypothetical protein n=1 Tax=Klebsiella pneumoniae TaxID=573 RepID=UPI000E2B4250|nr:hypothetical protein [Klebsiella pneumoniae]SWN52614.1 Uncharacterised protein [Klebsiella pneumoniae]
MSEINNIKQRFEELCKNPDFISAYNDFNGTSLASLSLSQLFSVGTLFHVVSIKTHDNQELLITDAYFDVQYQEKTYLATGDFTDISTIQESKEINNTGMTVRLSNVRTEYISLIGSKALDNSEVKIDIGFINPNNGSVQTSFNIFTGVIDKLSIQLDYNDAECKNETEATLDSIWAVLEKSARNHASDGIHRAYPGNENDSFFARIGKWNSEARWTSVK